MSDDKHLERLRAIAAQRHHHHTKPNLRDDICWAVAEIERLRSLVDVTREARDEATDVAKAKVQQG